MTRFEIDFFIGETSHHAEITAEVEFSRYIYTCVINNTIVFKIRKNNENKWENLEGNSSALSKLIGWEIDHYLKNENLKKKKYIGNWDINLS